MTLNGLRSRSRVTHGYFSGWWRARFNTAWAPTTRMRLRYWSPRFEIGPSFCSPPVELLPRYDPDPGCEVTPRSKNLRVRDSGGDGGRTHNANPRDAPEPLARFVRAMLSNDPPLDRSNHRLQCLKPCRQHNSALSRRPTRCAPIREQRTGTSPSNPYACYAAAFYSRRWWPERWPPSLRHECRRVGTLAFPTADARHTSQPRRVQAQLKMDINWKAIARTSNSLLSFHSLTIYFMRLYVFYKGRCMEMRCLAYRSSLRSCRSTRSPIYRQSQREVCTEPLPTSVARL